MPSALRGKMNAIRALARAVAQEESRADAVRDDGVAPRRAQRALVGDDVWNLREIVVHAVLLR